MSLLKAHRLRGVTLALAGLTLALTACAERSEEAPTRAERPRPVLSFQVEMRENTRRLQAVGTARARTAALIRAETAGIVDEVLFEPGSFVTKGTPLLALEADEERLAVRLANVAVQEAEQLLARYRRIENTGAVSDSAIDEARTQLEAAKINLEQARLSLAERTVIAPFAGYTGLTDIDAGSRITQDVTITALDDRRVLFIDFAVPEDAFGALALGDLVDVLPFSDRDGVRQAELVNLDSRVDPQSRAFTARAALDNEDDQLRPGMSFDVGVVVPGRRYPAVPEASIVWGANGAYLWVIENARTQQVAVTIIARHDGQVLVDGPLTEGARVVSEGVQKVREGTLVRDRERTAARRLDTKAVN